MTIKRQNPIRIKGTNFFVDLRDAQGVFVGALYSRAHSFSVYFKKLRISQSIPFEPGIKASEKRLIVKTVIANYRAKKKALVYKTRAKEALLKIKLQKKKIKKSKTRKEKLKERKKLERLRQIRAYELQKIQKLKLKKVKHSKKFPFKATKRVIKKDVFSSMNLHRDLNLVQTEFMHSPVPARLPELNKAFDKLIPLYLKKFEDVFDLTTKKSQRQFIFRVLYEAISGGLISIKGAGGGRMEVTRKQSLPIALETTLRHCERVMYSHPASYFKKGFLSEDVTLVGFTIEYINSMGRVLKGTKLEQRQQDWKQLQLDMKQKILDRQHDLEKTLEPKENIKLKKSKKRRKYKNLPKDRL